MGARPMARVIQEYIKKPLAEMVLFGELAQSGGTVEVAVSQARDKLVLVATSHNKLDETALST